MALLCGQKHPYVTRARWDWPVGSADTHKKHRRMLRKKLQSLGWSPEAIDAELARKAKQQAAKRAQTGADNRVANHHDARRKMRRRMEAEGISPRLIEAAVERLRAQQAAARRAGVGVADLEAIYEDTYRQMRLDDAGFKPNPGDALLRGSARATGATARAVKRGKATTKYEHDHVTPSHAIGAEDA